METQAINSSLDSRGLANPTSKDMAAEETLQNKDYAKYLSQELEDEKVMKALASSEGLAEPSESKKVKEGKFIRDTLPIIGYTAASTFHGLAWLHRMGRGLLPQMVNEFLDKQATNFSKTVNLLNYGGKAIVSFNANNSLDSISKALFPLIVSWVKLEDMFLAAGLSSGTTMMASAHNPRVTNQKKSFIDNLKQHGKAYTEMVKETFSPGGVKKLFSKDDFHLMHLGGNMNFFGGLGGLIADGMHPVIKTGFSFIRNSGGIICDLAKIVHGDINYLVSGILYIFTHVLDIWQTSIAKTQTEKARTISHLVQSINSVANYFYTKPSNTMADETFKDRVKELRQGLSPQLQPAFA